MSVIGHKAYIITNNKIWEFDNQTYMIEEKLSGNIEGQFSNVLKNKVYISSSEKILEYDPVSNQIKEISQLAYGVGTVFVWDGKLFNFVFSGVFSELSSHYYYIDPSQL